MTVIYGAYAVFLITMERDLIGMFRDQYRRYRERVSMLIPLPGGRKSDDRPVAARQATTAALTSPTNPNGE